MQYITNCNLGKVYLQSDSVKHIVVKRLSGEFHKYFPVTYKPSLHSVHDCVKMGSDYRGLKNSGATIVINYPVTKINESSFEEVDTELIDFTNSLYYHLGFVPCISCWKVESLRYELDFLTLEERFDQHQKDLEKLQEFFKNNPEEHNRFLGLN